MKRLKFLLFKNHYNTYSKYFQSHSICIYFHQNEIILSSSSKIWFCLNKHFSKFSSSLTLRPYSVFPNDSTMLFIDDLFKWISNPEPHTGPFCMSQDSLNVARSFKKKKKDINLLKRLGQLSNAPSSGITSWCPLACTFIPC